MGGGSGSSVFFDHLGPGVGLDKIGDNGLFRYEGKTRFAIENGDNIVAISPCLSVPGQIEIMTAKRKDYDIKSGHFKPYKVSFSNMGDERHKELSDKLGETVL